MSCRNIKDLVGNVSGEQIYDFYPDDGNTSDGGNFYSSNVYVRYSNFVEVSDISVGTRPWSVHTSDLDGDRDTGKYAISGKFKVDNRTGPIGFSASPGPNALNVLRGANIEVKFNEAVDFSSIFDVVNWEVKGLGGEKG